MTQIDLVQRLNSADPGWTINADVIVIGSGIAGLTAALSARDKGLSVLLLTKDVLSTGSTSWAQGGIAAALGPGDSPDQHFQDTLEAGAGLCDQESVRILVQEGPAAVKRLINLGATFDLDSSGNVALTREGGHRRDRIAHAGGDATGAEISRALVAKVLADPKVRIFEHALVLDLLKDKNERVCGVTLHVMGKGKIDGVGAALARCCFSNGWTWRRFSTNYKSTSSNRRWCCIGTKSRCHSCRFRICAISSHSFMGWFRFQRITTFN
jgi:L-aspartate oxidase